MFKRIKIEHLVIEGIKMKVHIENIFWCCPCMDFAPWLKVKYDFSNGAFKIWGMQSLISFGHEEKLIYAAFELPNFNYNAHWAGEPIYE